MRRGVWGVRLDLNQKRGSKTNLNWVVPQGLQGSKLYAATEPLEKGQSISQFMPGPLYSIQHVSTENCIPW